MQGWVQAVGVGRSSQLSIEWAQQALAADPRNQEHTTLLKEYRGSVSVILSPWHHGECSTASPWFIRNSPNANSNYIWLSGHTSPTLVLPTHIFLSLLWLAFKVEDHLTMMVVDFNDRFQYHISKQTQRTSQFLLSEYDVSGFKFIPWR